MAPERVSQEGKLMESSVPNGSSDQVVLILGATGTVGRLIAEQAVRSGHRVVLGGRRPERLEQLAGQLGTTPARSPLATVVVDTGGREGLDRAIASANVVVNTVGPFTRTASRVIDSCLAAGVHYVDLANELGALRSTLARDAEARARGCTVVTGAGYGVAASECLVMLLADQVESAIESVIVASYPNTAFDTPALRATVVEVIREGAVSYRGGRLHTAPLGSEIRAIPFADGHRRAVSISNGELEAARRAAQAPNATAYTTEVPTGPLAVALLRGLGLLARREGGRRKLAALVSHGGVRARSSDSSVSRAWARVETSDGSAAEAEVALGEGYQVAAAVAAEITRRICTTPTPGAWTAGLLCGSGLLDVIGGRTISKLLPHQQ
jgi:short subunit dehydrogenase-like uncharacterized protein